MSSATLTVLLSSLFVLAVFIAFTAAEDTEDTCTSTCVEDTEPTLIAMDWQSLMLILKLNDDGTAIVTRKKDKDSKERKKRQAGGMPDDKGGKPDDKGGKPDDKGGNSDGKGKGKKSCRPGKGEVTRLFKQQRKLGLPLVIKSKSIRLQDDKNNQFPMTPKKGDTTTICGSFSMELEDIDGAPINATLYVICNKFRWGNDYITAKVCVKMYVLHHDATLKNNKLLPQNGIK